MLLERKEMLVQNNQPILNHHHHKEQNNNKFTNWILRKVVFFAVIMFALFYAIYLKFYLIDLFSTNLPLAIVLAI